MTAWPGREGGTRLTAAEAAQLAYEFQVLADPTRLRILSFAAERMPEPTTVTALVAELRLSQSTVSHHVKVLLDAGYLTVQRAGTWSLYRPVAEALTAVAQRIAPQWPAASVDPKAATSA